jgi:hypothetical protein
MGQSSGFTQEYHPTGIDALEPIVITLGQDKGFVQSTALQQLDVIHQRGLSDQHWSGGGRSN